MQNHFVFSSHVVLLFKEWQVGSASVLVDAFVGLFLFTLGYEIARFYQSHFAGGRSSHSSARSENIDSEIEGSYGDYGTFNDGNATTTNPRAILRSIRARLVPARRYILLSLSYPLLLAANYCIMLVVMTYNAWLLISVCLASGLAYFLLWPDHDIPVVAQHSDAGPTAPLLCHADKKLGIQS